MLHTYIQLPDGTELGYSATHDDGSVLVGAVRSARGGHDLAVMRLPGERWLVTEGFSREELANVAAIVHGNAALIGKLAGMAREEDLRAQTGPTGAGAGAGAAGACVGVGGAGAGAGAAGATTATAATVGAAYANTSAETAPKPAHGAPASPHGAPSAESPVDGFAHAAAASARTAGGPAQAAAGPVPHSAPGAASSAHPDSQPDADHLHDYQQAASAVLDAASLLGRVAPGTRLGRVVNLAMPAARSVVTAAPGIVEKAAPAVSQAAKAAPEVAEKAARGLGRLGDKLAHAATDAVGDVADAAKRAAQEFKREKDVQ